MRFLKGDIVRYMFYDIAFDMINDERKSYERL